MQALFDVLATESPAAVCGQLVHPILILVIFLLGLFEGQSLQH
jgi:hypothetical protein